MTIKAYRIEGWGRAEFSPETIEMMRKTTEKSERERREIGFLLCKCFGRIVPSGEIVVGTYTEIPPEKLLATTCPRGCERVGYFHTHPDGIPHPTTSDIRAGVNALLPIVCVGTDRKITCYRIPGEIIEHRKKEEMYDEESNKVLKELMRKGYGLGEAMKHPKHDALIRKMYHCVELYRRPMIEFSEAIERQDRLTLRRYGKYGEPFLEVVW